MDAFLEGSEGYSSHGGESVGRGGTRVQKLEVASTGRRISIGPSRGSSLSG